MEPFGREQELLAAESAPAGSAVPGASLPDAELLGPDGAARSLSEAVGTGPAVLVFYRGGWCPYCSIALRAYQAELLSALRERGVPLIALSPQAPDGSLSTQEKNELEFDVLSDVGSAIAKAAGILTAPADDSLAAQRELGLDLTAVNGDGTVGLPMPTTAIVDGSLTVRWIDIHPDYTTRSEPAEILAALEEIA
jgi:peroxiredoxin